MANKYTKISNAPTKSVDDLYSRPGSINRSYDSLITTDGSIYNISLLGQYFIEKCPYADNTIYTVLKPDPEVSEFTYYGTLNDNITSAKLFIEGPASKIYSQMVINKPGVNSPVPITVNLTENNTVYKPYKNALISSLILSADNFDELPAKNTKIFKHIKFENAPIEYLALYDSGVQSLEIKNCDNLTKCIFGKFDSISTIIINGTNCTGSIRINKVSDYPMIDIMLNNCIPHIEIHGNGNTILNEANCKISNNNTKSICFINCNVSDSLITKLENEKVEVIKIKKAV